MADFSLFRVEFVIPPDGDKHSYHRNMRKNVLTDTVRGALDEVARRNPTAVVHAVHRLTSVNDEVYVDRGLEIVP
ncbi:MAG: hypothetical protein OK436_06235 [Thaumarchaeota archaeon]|nr:hypothetical protein [Nitrososphaerota archaeon]